MLAKRLIPCLDVANGQVVKGVRFRDHQVVGDIVTLAAEYARQGADELVFYDITASPQGRSVDTDWVAKVAAEIDIPFCVAGGIRDVAVARAVLHSGADKVSVNTPALLRPQLISELADAFGSQCVVVGIDSIETDSGYAVKQMTGLPEAMADANRDTLEWIVRVQQLGAGEIVLNCMDADGVREGYHVPQLEAARAVCQVPLIASGGAGAMQHFVRVFQQADVDGALAASVFHSGEIEIPRLKSHLRAAGVPVRDDHPVQ
jgi:cyclase